MRFQQIAVGERFEFEGEVYVKVDALIAQIEGSHTRRLIPRYAQLNAPGCAVSDSADAATVLLQRGTATTAFDAFYARCLEIVEELAADLPAERMKSVRGRLGAARQAYLDQSHQ